jgi:hypothetical protein
MDYKLKLLAYNWEHLAKGIGRDREGGIKREGK